MKITRLLQYNVKTVRGTNDRCTVLYALESFCRKSIATLTLIFDDLHEIFLLIYVKLKSEFEYLRMTTNFCKNGMTLIRKEYLIKSV